ncbi:hypothetical protein [Caballeronia temeraria]|uniref:hypothetical protein n=1 Tax=Caballeronia temeraria TaxID=1777137 RepID=UPI0012FD2D7A|nr:hypothetical protein [Caballeronia temeraria]
MDVKTSSDADVRYSISNMGDRPSYGASLLAVAWGIETNEIGFVRMPLADHVPATSPVDPGTPGQLVGQFGLNISDMRFGPAAVPITDLNKLTALYLAVFDPPFDPPDMTVTELFKAAMEGRQYLGDQGIHPCRVSRQLACAIPRQTPAFRVSGNTLYHEVAGYIDFFLTSRGTSASADLLVRPDDQLLFSDIAALELGGSATISRVKVPSGQIEFVLRQDDKVASSADPSHAQIHVTQETTDVISINWNDPAGNDGDFGDFVMTLVHH